MTPSLIQTKWCVPSALSLLTGFTYDESLALLRTHGLLGDAPISGVYPGNAIIALRSIGYECRSLEPFDMTLGQIAERIRRNNVSIQGKYLIEIPGHALVLQSNKVWDSSHITGIGVKEYSRKRSKVLRMWEVRR